MTPPSLAEFVKVSAYAVIFTVGWRLIAAQLTASDKPLAQSTGKAMAGVYS